MQKAPLDGVDFGTRNIQIFWDKKKSFLENVTLKLLHCCMLHCSISQKMQRQDVFGMIKIQFFFFWFFFARKVVDVLQATEVSREVERNTKLRFYFCFVNLPKFVYRLFWNLKKRMSRLKLTSKKH